MKCSNCGAENLDTMRFCTVCGTALSSPSVPSPVSQSGNQSDAYFNAPTAAAPAPAPVSSLYPATGGSSDPSPSAPYSPSPYASPAQAPSYSTSSIPTPTAPAPSSDNTYQAPVSSYGQSAPSSYNQPAPSPYGQPGPSSYDPSNPYGQPAPPPSPYGQSSEPVYPGSMPVPAAPTLACGNCGKPFGPNEANCTNCGAPISIARPIQPAKKKSSRGLIFGIAGVLLVVVIALVVLLVVMPSVNYNKAIDAYNAGNYQVAYDSFTKLGEHKDSVNYAALSKQFIDYDVALADFDNGNFESAKEKFLSLGSFQDAADKVVECDLNIRYQAAQALYDNEEFEKAYLAFKELGGFKDSAQLADNCEQPTPSTGLLEKGPAYSNSGVSFNLDNNLNVTFLLFIYTEDGTYYCSVWMNAFTDTTITLAPGTYYFTIIQYDYDSKWFGVKDKFGSSASEFDMTVDGEKLLEINEDNGISWG